MKTSNIYWDNTYPFFLNIHITDKSNITDFMVKHSMFPGNVARCTVNMKPNNHGSMQVHVKVMDSIHLKDEFDLDQGQFCKVMANIYSPEISLSKN